MDNRKKVIDKLKGRNKEDILRKLRQSFIEEGDILPHINEGASSKSDAYSDLHIVPTSMTRASRGLTVSSQALSSEEEIRTCPALSMFKLAL